MAELMHGAGHTVARALVDQTPGVLRLENVLEHRSPGHLARRLSPFGGIAGAEEPGPPIAWLAVGHPQPWTVRIKAAPTPASPDPSGGRLPWLARPERRRFGRVLAPQSSDGIRHWTVGPEIGAVGTDPSLRSGPFQQALLLACGTTNANDIGAMNAADQLIETLRESRFIALLPLLRFKWWRSQSRTRVMTTAAPVSAACLDLIEDQEVAALALETAGREQS
jgi:hypothetical protein